MGFYSLKPQVPLWEQPCQTQPLGTTAGPVALDTHEAGISAALGNGISCKPQCLNLYVSALDPPELLLPILPVPPSPGNTAHSSVTVSRCLQKQVLLALPSTSPCGIRNASPGAAFLEAKLQGRWVTRGKVPALAGRSSLPTRCHSWVCCYCAQLPVLVLLSILQGWQEGMGTSTTITVCWLWCLPGSPGEDMFVIAPANPGFCQPCREPIAPMQGAEIFHGSTNDLKINSKKDFPGAKTTSLQFGNTCNIVMFLFWLRTTKQLWTAVNY